MFTTTVILFFRSLYRSPSYSITTIAGLVVGITTALAAFLWVTYELTYNHVHPDTDQVFLLMANERVDGEVVTGDETPVPFDFLVHDVPEIEAATRIDNTMLKLTVENTSLQKRGVFADSTFFQVHPASIISGDAVTPLRDNSSIAISQTLAELLFKDKDALGETVYINQQKAFKVSAVYEAYASNSDLRHIDFVLPFNGKERDPEDVWINTRVKLYSPSGKVAAEKKINAKLNELSEDDDELDAFLFCMTDWRLRWSFENGVQSGGRYVYVFIFGLSGLLILALACINYMNIATARATARAREIGVRKVSGATQSILVRQFMTESMLMILLSTVVAVGVTHLLLPIMNDLAGTSLSMSFRDPLMLAILSGIILFTGLLAGSYPAFVLSSFRPSAVLKGNMNLSVAGGGLRKALVTFQLTLSVLMIFCSLVMWQQTNFLLEKDLGYDKQHVINVWLDASSGFSIDNVKSDLLVHSAIQSAAFGGASPMEINGWSETNRIENPFPNPVMFYSVNIDADFLAALKFDLIQGRNFSPERASDSSNFIITEKAARVLGFANPIGQRISCNAYAEQEGEIIGVIKDFHHNDIHEAINPVVLVYGKKNYLANLFVRYQPGELEAALLHVTSVYKKHFPEHAFNYSLLDRDFENQFYTEKLIRKLSITFTIIAIVVSCLGLFSLALFNAQRRTKEIGIRKVLGASVRQIVAGLNRDLVIPVLISFCLAFPAGYYLMNIFLRSYPFRVNISGFDFLMVSGLIMSIVVLTTGYHSLRAATRNPTESLKSE